LRNLFQPNNIIGQPNFVAIVKAVEITFVLKVVAVLDKLNAFSWDNDLESLVLVVLPYILGIDFTAGQNHNKGFIQFLQSLQHFLRFAKGRIGNQDFPQVVFEEVHLLVYHIEPQLLQMGTALAVAVERLPYYLVLGYQVLDVFPRRLGRHIVVVN